VVWRDDQGRMRKALIYKIFEREGRAVGFDRTDFPRYDTRKFETFALADIVVWDVRFPEGVVG
jgi:hypothetical protein